MNCLTHLLGNSFLHTSALPSLVYSCNAILYLFSFAHVQVLFGLKTSDKMYKCKLKCYCKTVKAICFPRTKTKRCTNSQKCGVSKYVFESLLCTPRPHLFNQNTNIILIYVTVFYLNIFLNVIYSCDANKHLLFLLWSILKAVVWKPWFFRINRQFTWNENL